MAYSQRAHSHKEVCIGLIRGGITHFFVTGEKIVLTKGDLIYIPPEMIHLCTPLNPEEFSFIMLYLDEEWLSKLIGGIPSHIAPFKAPVAPSLEKLMRDLLRRGYSRPDWEEGFKALIGAIFVTDEAQTAWGCRITEELSAKKIIRAKAQAGGPLSVEEMATLAGMSKFAFIRKYAGLYGLTPHADLTNERIRSAMDRIRTSEESLTDIAQNAGFSDQSHFTRQFKLYTGLLPSEYRKAILSKTDKTH